jgi:spore coat protein A
LTFVNTAGAPFDGAGFPPERAGEAFDLEALLPYPDVLRFRTAPGDSARRAAPAALASDFAPPDARALEGAVRRAVALVEQELQDSPNMLTLRELAEVPGEDPGGPLITVVEPDSEGGETVTRFRAVACHFEDTATFFPVLDEWEVWQFINLSGDTHPMHIHLASFPPLARHPITVTIPPEGVGACEIDALVRREQDPEDQLEHVLDANERGLKDTVRVNPKEIV